VSVETALEVFFKPDYLKGENKYRCEKCRTKVDAKKQYKITKAPPTIVLHLKRFNFQSRKISKEISFSEKLDLHKYMDGQSSGGSKYKLIGLVEHLGSSLYSGHYVSFVQTADRWFSVNEG
jgi:ubiquitin carboxyl-terminal hydrolase 36/42